MGCRPRLLCSTSTVLQPATGQVTFGRIPRRICDLVGARPLSEARAQDDHDASHSCRLQRGGPGGGDLPGVLRTQQPSSRRRSDQQRGVRGVQACGVRRVRRNADTGRSCAVPDVQGTAPTASAAVQHVSKVPRLCCALARLLRLLRARLAALGCSRHPQGERSGHKARSHCLRCSSRPALLQSH